MGNISSMSVVQRITMKRLLGAQLALIMSIALTGCGAGTFTGEVPEKAPPCDPSDAPLRLSGYWLDILGADGHAERDLIPPYDLDLWVKDAPGRRYDGAFLTLRVPKSLGHPLTKDDVRTAIDNPRVIVEFTARCKGPRFLASEVATHPQDRANRSVIHPPAKRRHGKCMGSQAMEAGMGTMVRVRGYSATTPTRVTPRTVARTTLP